MTSTSRFGTRGGFWVIRCMSSLVVVKAPFRCRGPWPEPPNLGRGLYRNRIELQQRRCLAAHFPGRHRHNPSKLSSARCDATRTNPPISCSGNPAAAENALAIVEDRRLSGRNRPRRRIEIDGDAALRLETNPPKGADVAMTDFDPHGRVWSRRIANPVSIQ